MTGPVRGAGGPTTRPELLVLDVDGTLLGDDGSLPAARARALEVVTRVVPTILATGKTWPSVSALAQRFDLAGPHLTCNGAAAVTLDGGVEVLAPLDPDLARRVLDTLHGRGLATATYLADGTSIAPSRAPGHDRIARVAEAPPEVADLGADDVVLKVLAVVHEDDEPHDLRALAADAARIQRTGPWFLEWNHPRASKGDGLALLLRRRGIDPMDVVAVGDSENDVSMFGVAACGVAVAEASAVAVEAADVHLGDDVAMWLTAVAALPPR